MSAKIISLLLIAIVFAANGCGTQRVSSQTNQTLMPSPTPTPKPTEIGKLENAVRLENKWSSKFAFDNKTIAEKVEGKYWYELSAEYPQIKQKQSPNIKAFNSWIKTKVLGYVGRFRWLIKEEKRKKSHHVEWGLNLSCEVYYSDDEFISLRLMHTVMEAGQMHPIDYYETLNYDLKNNRLLTLKDLYKSEEEYLKRVSSYCRKELKEQYEMRYTDNDWIDRGTEPKKENFPNWILTPDGIFISFEDYQVGSHAFGQPDILIPYSELKGVLKEKNLVEKFLK